MKFKSEGWAHQCGTDANYDDIYDGQQNLSRRREPSPVVQEKPEYAAQSIY
jgi:hypothetical protein